MDIKTKHPTDVKTFSIDWTDVLGSATIATASATASGVTVDASTYSGAISYHTISAGTAGQRAYVEARITTSNSQSLSHTFIVDVQFDYVT